MKQQEQKQKKQKPRKRLKTNIQALKEKLRRLDVVYMNGNLSDEDYMKQQTEIKNAIKKQRRYKKNLMTHMTEI